MAKPSNGYRQRNKIGSREMELIRAYRQALIDAEAKVAEERRQREEADHKPVVYGYVRESHQDSKDSGLGEEGQRRTITAMAQLVRADHPELPEEIQWEEEPDAVSAYSVELRDRPKGYELDHKLMRGDHVVFAFLHRAFRDPVDCNMTMRAWKQRGIVAHFADLRIDTDTAMGECMMNLAATFARWYSAIISEATRSAFSGMKKLGRLSNGHAPMGFKLVGPKGVRRVAVPDPEQHHVMAEIVRVRDKYGWSFKQVAEHIENWITEKTGRKPLTILDMQKGGRRRWTSGKCRRAYDAELELRRKEAKGEREDTMAG